jgi:hypothetical protein
MSAARSCPAALLVDYGCAWDESGAGCGCPLRRRESPEANAGHYGKPALAASGQLAASQARKTLCSRSVSRDMFPAARAHMWTRHDSAPPGRSPPLHTVAMVVPTTEVGLSCLLAEPQNGVNNSNCRHAAALPSYSLPYFIEHVPTRRRSMLLLFLPTRPRRMGTPVGRHLLLATFRRARPAACLEGGEGSQWINARDGSSEIDAWTGMADPHAATSCEIDAWTGEVTLEDAGKTSSPPSSPASAPRTAALPPSQVRGAACGSLGGASGRSGSRRLAALLMLV